MQTSFSEFEYSAKKKQTRRDRFLAEIEAVTPWSALLKELEPHYPKGEGRGRPPIGLERMLRMYVAQQCFGLSDEGIEDAVYDSQAIRRFVGIDMSRESAPDATTLLKFRHLLEANDLTRKIFGVINAHLAQKGLMMREGTIVDATLISAPSSTKNRDNARDPEMHQTKKGGQWYFGMKAHIGVDHISGLVHSLVGTPANTSDVTQVHALLHGEEKAVFGDSAYQGAGKRKENSARTVLWFVSLKPHTRRKYSKEYDLKEMVEKLERAKARIRSKVEHAFHVIKNLFKHKKTRYRGLAKNTAQLFTLFGFANLMRAKRSLIDAHALNPS
jgi:IS5 family transposase